jgi:hypothetical protein
MAVSVLRSPHLDDGVPAVRPRTDRLTRVRIVTAPATRALAGGMLALAVVATAGPAIRNAPTRLGPAATTPLS